MSNNSNGIRGVRIETVGPPERLSDFTDDQLYRLMVEKMRRDREFMEQRAHQFARVVRAAMNDHLYRRVGYDTLEDYVHDVIQRPWEWVEAALRICDTHPHVRMVEFAEAVDAARKNPAGKPGAPEGNDNRARERENNVGNVTFEQERGNAQEYTLRRLARDRPDLLDRVEAGELSPNAAAIEAGFRRKKIRVEPSPQSVQRMLERYLPGWRLVNTETGESL